MKPRSATLYLLMVFLPIGLICWLGIRLAGNEKVVLEQRFDELLRARLRDTQGLLSQHIELMERDFLAIASRTALDTTALRGVLRNDSKLTQILLVGRDGEILHPPIGSPMNRGEKDFLIQNRQIWEGDIRAQLIGPPGETQGISTANAGSDTHGWHHWQSGTKMNYIFWVHTAKQDILVFVLNRARMISDILTVLPDTAGDGSSLPNGSIVMTDPLRNSLYQWGLREPARDELPKVTHALEPPLTSWHLKYFVDPAAYEPSAVTAAFNIVAGLSSVAIVLVLIAIYFYREHSREIREAEQRVTFVNQVSHELKTPLTNIRLYAELMEDAVDEDSKVAHHLGVILSESHRLSRLIGNILTFGRSQRETLQLRLSPGRVDQSIAAAIELFRPSLERVGLDVSVEYGADSEVEFDEDVLHQILGNLFVNVEKYAASGKFLRVTSRQVSDSTVIIVSYGGPGIPENQREKVFEPFHRLSDKVTEGVTGTGIGLSISRMLARLHGGDLVIIPSDIGATFQLTISTKAKTDDHTDR